ncbi:MAG: hypothetical protein JXR19_01560 [Bacteroidia bacterium]
MNSWIIIAITIAVAALIIRLLTKVVFKILAFVLVLAVVVGLLYYFSIGPFKAEHLTIEGMEEKYCGEEGDEDICDCVVIMLYSDLENRFSEEELSQMKSDKAKMSYVLIKSLAASKEKSLECLRTRNAEDKYNEFYRDMVPIANKDLKNIREKAGEIKDRLSQGVDSLKKGFEDIDDRY